MNYSSKLLENAVDQISRLPGIGKRTALRLALYLMRQPPEQSEELGRALISMRQDLKFCSSCHNMSDNALCGICANPRRDRHIICIVEDIRDVMAIENTSQYKGLYHVLGGKISPMEGIGPGDLQIAHLIQRLGEESIEEVIFALSPTIEGDTTNFYLYRQVETFPVRISAIARGISVGDELEYADEITLGRSILHRIPYEKSVADH